MHNKSLIIFNMVLIVVAVVLFGIGYYEKKNTTKRYNNDKHKDYYKAVLDGGKFNYMVVNIIFGRFIPTMIFFEVIFSYFYGTNKITITSMLIKLVVALVAGIIYAVFQWNFMQNLYNHNKEAFTNMRFMSYYMFFNGIIRWGVIIGAAVCYYPDIPFTQAALQFSSWIFAGLFFGYVDWTRNRMAYANYLNIGKTRKSRWK